MSKFDKVRSQAKDYLFFVLWLLKDSVLRLKKHVVLYITLALTATVMHIASLAFAIKYLTAIVKNGPIEFGRLGLTFTPENMEFAPFLVGGALLVSAMAQFFSNMKLARMMRLYEEIVFNSFMKVFLRRSFFVSPEDGQFVKEEDLVRIATRSARVCGRALNIIWSSIVPGVVTVAAGSFLIYLNPVLSISLFGFAALFLYFYIKVGRHASQLAGGIDQYVREDSKSRIFSIRFLNKVGGNTKEQREMAEQLLSQTESKSFLDTYELRLKVVHYGLLIGNIMLAVSVCAVFSFFTFSPGLGENVLSYALFYFLGLNYCFGNLRTVGKSVTTLNIFFPYFRHYVAFVSQYKVKKAAKGQLPDEFDLKPKSSEDHRPVKWDHNTELVVCVDEVLEKTNLKYILQSLLGQDFNYVFQKNFNISMATSTWPLLKDDFAYTMKLVVGDIDLKREYPFSRFHEAYDELEKQFSGDGLTVGEWNRIDPTFRFVVSVISVLKSSTSIVVLDGQGYFRLSQEEREFILSHLKKQFVLVVNPPLDKFDGGVLSIEQGELLLKEATEIDQSHIYVAPVRRRGRQEPEIDEESEMLALELE